MSISALRKCPVGGNLAPKISTASFGKVFQAIGRIILQRKKLAYLMNPLNYIIALSNK